MEYLVFAAGLARAAGDVLRFYASREKKVEAKGRANLVTIADRESEALIIREIQRQYPSHEILAEESGSLGRTAGPAAGRWIIDPLDGTTNYAHGYPAYSVSIGFEQEGRLQCGVVYDPVRDELFSAGRDAGAHLNDRPLRVSAIAGLPDALLLTGFSYRFRDRAAYALGLFGALLHHSQGVRRSGSAALDLCYVAAGRCDGFWELDLHPWDTAAAVVIIEEAGGRVSNFEGGAFTVDQTEILASNGALHDGLMEAILEVKGRSAVGFQRSAREVGPADLEADRR